MAEPGRPSEEMVSRAEKLLATHADFGDTGLIWCRASARLRFALEILGERLPGVAAALSVLSDNGCLPAVLRDPVVRRSIESVLQRKQLGVVCSPDDIEQVLEQAARQARPGDHRVPTQIEEGCGLQAGPDGRIWVLGFPAASGPLSSRLARASIESFIEWWSDRTGELNPGTSRTVELVDRACDVLVALLPQLGRGVLRHVVALGMVTAESGEGQMLSAAGGSPMPGTIAVRPEQLERPWDAAGRMLHEALHLKLFDICVCTPLFADLDSKIQVPWRPVPWEMRRVLAAFHFYAHVVLFHAAVRVRGELFAGQFGVPPANPGVSTSGNESYTQPAERLRYLAEQLLGQLAKDLTPAGRRFVCWQLDAIAPLTGSRLAAAAVDPPAVRHAHPHEGYKHANGIVTRPDLESGSLFAFNPKRGTLHVLNLAAWVAFELCDGRDLAALRSSYAGIVASKLTTHGAASHLDNALAQLHEAGLITPVDGRAPVR